MLDIVFYILHTYIYILNVVGIFIYTSYLLYTIICVPCVWKVQLCLAMPSPGASRPKVSCFGRGFREEMGGDGQEWRLGT